MMQILNTHSRARWAGWLIVTALVFLVLLVLGYLYRHYLFSGLDLIGEATGGRTSAALCLALGALALVWLVIWMFFPLLVYFGLKDLSRRTAELNQTMKLCAQHLARTTPEPPAAKTQSSASARPQPGAQAPL